MPPSPDYDPTGALKALAPLAVPKEYQQLVDAKAAAARAAGVTPPAHGVELETIGSEAQPPKRQSSRPPAKVNTVPRPRGTSEPPPAHAAEALGNGSNAAVEVVLGTAGALPVAEPGQRAALVNAADRRSSKPPRESIGSDPDIPIFDELEPGNMDPPSSGGTQASSGVPAIQAMRIIAVGTPPPPAPPEPTVDLGTDIEITDGLDDTDPLLEALLAQDDSDDASADSDLAELSDDDVSPDSDPGSRSEATATAQRQQSAKAEAKPPPPPRRASISSPALEATEPEVHDGKKTIEEPGRKARRAWWEIMFGEDFMRANFKLNDAQIAREATFIEESLGVAPGGVVLDLACGTGQHAVELASRGYGVVGYDLSLYQLALAADVAQERGQKLNLLQGDMREMAFEEMFDGIYSWNTSFGYFEEEKNLNVAQRIFRALRPGGMFLIDVANRDFVAMCQPSQVWFEGDACVCMDDMQLDFITSRLRVKRSLILDDGRTRECMYSVRLYTLHELGKLLHDVGFRVTEASGHPVTPGVFFGQNSPRIIMLAQRP